MTDSKSSSADLAGALPRKGDEGGDWSFGEGGMGMRMEGTRGEAKVLLRRDDASGLHD